MRLVRLDQVLQLLLLLMDRPFPSVLPRDLWQLPFELSFRLSLELFDASSTPSMSEVKRWDIRLGYHLACDFIFMEIGFWCCGHGEGELMGRWKLEGKVYNRSGREEGF
jgi:hypothetical protein